MNENYIFKVIGNEINEEFKCETACQLDSWVSEIDS